MRYHHHATVIIDDVPRGIEHAPELLLGAINCRSRPARTTVSFSSRPAPFCFLMSSLPSLPPEPSLGPQKTTLSASHTSVPQVTPPGGIFISKRITRGFKLQRRYFQPEHVQRLSTPIAQLHRCLQKIIDQAILEGSPM